ncbi:hypothetical protein KGY79_12880, partial [Candidatus Bipolaricaulota bacterium]|nr:hypothetical protein [Candidatus Bipolaricaulota bacterium]
MSKVISAAAVRGAHKYFSRAENAWEEVREKKGEEEKVSFPNTGYDLPLILSLTGEKVQT